LPLLLERDGFAHRHSYLYLGKIQDLWGNRDEARNYYNHVLSYPEYDEAQDQARNLIREPYKHDTDEKKVENN
jgi:hypothetical protein